MSQRNVRELKVWMIRKKLRQEDIAKATGEERSYVCKTLNGKRNNRVVLAWLKEKGCPVKHLGLPDDMKQEAVA